MLSAMLLSMSLMGTVALARSFSEVSLPCSAALDTEPCEYPNMCPGKLYHARTSNTNVDDERDVVVRFLYVLLYLVLPGAVQLHRIGRRESNPTVVLLVTIML